MEAVRRDGMKKYRKFWIAALVLAAVLLWANRTPDPVRLVEEQLGEALPKGEVLETLETHGGFHGDGMTFIKLRLEDDISGQLADTAFWHPLPLSETMEIALYGKEGQGPYLGGDGVSLPVVEQGFYYFCDRHSEALDPADDAGLISRGSLNYTAAIYDSDTRMLYYLKIDT